MFVALVGNPCPWIYIPTNLYTIIYQTYPDYNTNEIIFPQTKTILSTHKHWPPRIKMIPQ